MRNERGITLIALVATVGVLIIITSVTVKMALIDNDAVVKVVINETQVQQKKVEEEKNKISDVIGTYEEEWGIS